MKYITEDKLLTYLKLKKEMAIFIGVGEYFESRTFEWVKLQYSPEAILCSLIKSTDDGSFYVNDVLKFSTINELLEERGINDLPATSGDIKHCIEWIKSQFNVDTNKFILIQDLNGIYSSLVEEGKLGLGFRW